MKDFENFKENMINLGEEALKNVIDTKPRLRASTLNENFVVEYARKIDAKVLIRGIRNVNDFSYEFDLSLVNHNLNPEIETLFMPTETRYVIVKSSSIKELAQFGGDISGMVPPVVCEAVLKKYRK